MSKTKKGFTLAEVLITLGIIGIVAAMTMPSIIQKQERKSLETRFKKSYSVLSQTLMLVKIENGEGMVRDFATWDGVAYHRAAEFAKLFYDKSKVTGKCTYTKQVMNYNNTKEGWVDRGVLNPDKQLPDGSCINVRIISGQINFTVDTNGAKSGPNRLGHDIFYFIVDGKDNLIPIKATGKVEEDDLDERPEYGEQQGNPCYMSSKQKGNGMGCAWFAVVNKCPEDPRKTFWECLP